MQSLHKEDEGVCVMGKARTDRRGNTREQKLQRENEKLKKQINSLRKQLSRLDLDRYSTVRDIIEEHYRADNEQKGREILENLKQIWKCNSCNEGHLQIFIYNRRDATYYYRVCSNAPNCYNRTLPKLYDPSTVKGIVKKEEN